MLNGAGETLIAPGDPPDLNLCDREPLHIPGAIQPHGLLIAFTEPDLRIASVSANLARFCAAAPESLTGAGLSELIDAPGLALLQSALQEAGRAATPLPIGLRPPALRPLDGVLHRHDGLAFLELEEPVEDDVEMSGFFRHTGAAIKQLEAARKIEPAAALVAGEMRRLTGFDRIAIYRFAEDFSGQVIAEDRAGDIEPFLGLHFPAGDIPAQARALYLRNPIRIIPDIDYRPAALMPDRNPRTGLPIDLSHAALRSVSPVHIEYMRNIGMRASMSVSVLHGGRLWGMIACHHRTPRRVSHDTRQACEMMAQVFAWQVGVLEDEAVRSQILKAGEIQRSLLSESEHIDDHRAGLLSNAAALLSLMGASGLCLYESGTTTSIGRTPPPAALERLVSFARLTEGQAAIFHTDRLSALLPEAAAYAELASGVLAVPLSPLPSGRVMLWFRPEVAQTVLWAGDPHKAARPDASGRLGPRQSFAAWRETSRGRALPWQTHEIAAAEEIRSLVIDVIMRNAERLERVNRHLARSNEELEAFAHVASHDIKEPLRHIEVFAGLLGEAIGGMRNAPLGTQAVSTQAVCTMVGGIERSARRLRDLIDGLAGFSLLGRRKLPPTATSLQAVMQEVVDDLCQPIAHAAATVDIGALPTLDCDRNQIRQVLQNLLSNALKYRHPDRPCHIRIFAASEDDGARAEPAIRICFADNGIGFDPVYAEQVFEPFKRLHGPDAYEGSGIGLAICRKILRMHGGRIGAASTPGIGSTFWFSLPLHAAGPEAGAHVR